MNKFKSFLVGGLLVLPVFAIAAPTQPFTTSVDNVQAALGNQAAEAMVKKGTTTIVSPRTGISYTLGNTEGRAITFQTEAIAPANNITVKRIVASNPALSAKSQQKAEQSLLDMPTSN